MIEIRPFAQPDQPAVSDFISSIYVELDWNKDQQAFLEGLVDLHRYFGGDRSTFLVAYDDNRVVGTGGIKELDERTALLKRLFIAAPSRGTGLAQEMVRRLISFAAERGYARIVLDTNNRNERAKRFYEKLGFRRFRPPTRTDWPESKAPDRFVYYQKSL